MITPGILSSSFRDFYKLKVLGAWTRILQASNNAAGPLLPALPGVRALPPHKLESGAGLPPRGQLGKFNNLPEPRSSRLLFLINIFIRETKTTKVE